MSTETKEPTVRIGVRCIICKKIQNIDLTESQAQRITMRGSSGELVQNIIPNLPASEREIFVSQVCGTCYDEMFA